MISNEIQLFLDCFAGRGSWNSVPHIVKGVISGSNRIGRIRPKANTAPCEAVSVDFWRALHLFETGRDQVREGESWAIAWSHVSGTLFVVLEGISKRIDRELLLLLERGHCFQLGLYRTYCITIVILR